MKCFFNDVDWVVAKDEQDAWTVWCESSGESKEDYDDSMTWEEIPMDNVLTLFNDECGMAGDGPRSRTVEEWIKINGRGFLMSTEY